MPAIDPFVKALADLCSREGGYASVADKAKVNADSLWQVLTGVKLPSGNPRGIGPGTRKKLTDAYPDWLDVKTSHHPQGDKQHLPLMHPGSANTAINWIALQEQAVDVMSAAMDMMTDEQRKEMSAKLAAWALAPDSAKIKKSISESLGSTASGSAVGNIQTPNFLKR